MTPVQYHYFYRRTQRRSAVTLIINVIVLLAMFYAAHRWLKPTDAGRQALFWINLAVPVVSLGLLLMAAYFWRKNGTFKITVSDTHFEIEEPFILGSSFRVPIADIVDIRQIHQKHIDHALILMRMKSGEKHQITMNRSFNRGKLYAALAALNPNIALPKNPRLFSQS